MIALVFGKNTSGVVKRLKEVYKKDDVEGFSSLSAIVSRMKTRQERISRIVCSATGVQHEQELALVHDYLSQNNLTTQVVLIARGFSEEDKRVVDVFHTIYHLPIYTDVMITGSVDVELLKGICYGDIDSLRLSYSIKKDEQVSTLASYVVEEAPKEIKKRAPYCLATSGVLKTFTYGGKFFGRRRFTKQQQKEVTELLSEARVVGVRK